MPHQGFESAAELKACRKAAGWTQLELATRTGFNVRTVKYHEGRNGRIDGVAPAKFRRALEAVGAALPFKSVIKKRSISGATVFMMSPSAAKPSAPQPLFCGAMTRKGLPCVAKPIGGSSRCRNHGGLSTGPKSAEGKARIAAAARKRWASWSKTNAEGDFASKT